MRIYTYGLCDFMHMREVPNYHELTQRLTFRAEYPCLSLLNGMTIIKDIVLSVNELHWEKIQVLLVNRSLH